MARGWKRAAEVALSRSGLALHMARRSAPSAAILAYHNVVPTGEAAAGDLSLHVDQRDFGRQLDFLLEHCDVVPLEGILDEGSAGTRPRVSITFDDGYRGTMAAGVEELTRRGLPATVFVPPGLLGRDGFWWDLLAPPGSPLPDTVRTHALSELAGEQDRVLDWARSEALPRSPLPEHAHPCSEAELLSAARGEGIRLGAHTWSHPNLAGLTEERARAEMRTSLEWIRERAPRGIEWLSYPFGISTDSVASVARAEFDGALRVDGGLAQRRGRWTGAPERLPRINVPRGLSLDGLAVRLASITS